MSHGSVTGRMSSSTSPSASAWREAHSIASSSDRARRMLKPAGSSFPRSNGPSRTSRVPDENRSRTPSELGAEALRAAEHTRSRQLAEQSSHARDQLRARE